MDDMNMKLSDYLCMIGFSLFGIFVLGAAVLSGQFGVIGSLICIAIVIVLCFAIKRSWNKIKKDITAKRIAKENQQQRQEFERQQQEYKKRQQDYERGDYYGTFEYTKQSLMHNENTANYRKLGYMYENGYGTAKDYDKAMKCYEKANAWREIGYMHYFGLGVPENKDKANEYFAKCDDIEDCKKVIEYFDSIERIASGKNPFLGYSEKNALFNLGLSYAEGKGVYQDYQKALLCYKEAADLGDKYAYNNLGVMYGTGKGVERDYYTARSYYQKAADLGCEVACDNLGNYYENGRGGGVDKYKALKYYKKACDLGGQKGCENFKRLKKEMGIRNDDDVLF